MLTDLAFHPNGVDGFFGPGTEKAVIRFQEFAGIYADGVVGPQTMEALERPYQSHSIEQNSPGVSSTDGNPERLAFVRVAADKHGEGYDRFWLRSDVVDAYNAVRKDVNLRGGFITSSGARRSLNAHVSYNRSATSFHYTGRAIDLFVWSALVDPKTDPYVVQLENKEERRLRVWARCKPDAEVAVDEITLGDILVQGEPNFQTRHSVTGHFYDLTQRFADAGFQSIRYRRRFEDNGDALASEWWHFQYEGGLIPGVSTFGGELLKVYAMEQLEATPPWRFRDRVFKVNWF
jgi:hypothetical protein